MRLLTFTNLYPNPVQPRHGIFVEHRLRRMVATGRVTAQVIAPVPWFPLPMDRRYPHYRVRGVPAVDERSGINVYHPPYWMVPGLSSYFNPWSMMRAALPRVRQLLAQGYDFDVLDAQFIYPDGIAGVMIGAQFGKPVTLTARGSDVNVALRETVPRRWFNWAKSRVAAFITVSSALKLALIDLGVPASEISVIRNGVDLTLFNERDRDAARCRLGLEHPTLLSLGNLIEGKGHRFGIEALTQLGDSQLMVIGQGPEGERLQQLATKLGVRARVRFIPHVDQAELASYYSAADVTVLASSNEGMANVLLESLACGTPVVATAVGGNPEVVADAVAGLLIEERSTEAVVSAVRRVLSFGGTRAAVRAYAQRFGWDEPIAAQVQLLEQIMQRHRCSQAPER